LAVAALLLHMLLPFYAYYPSHQGKASPDLSVAAPLFGGKVLICTADGFKLIDLSALQDRAEQPTSGRDPAKPHQPYQCPLCYVAAHGLAAPPAAVALSLPSLFEASLVTAHADYSPLAGEARWYRLRTRSPPAAIG
jgi:hypothetical protein